MEIAWICVLDHSLLYKSFAEILGYSETESFSYGSETRLKAKGACPYEFPLAC
jgi:hypothetical protein